MAKLRIALTEPVERRVIDQMAIGAGWTLINVVERALVFATPDAKEIVTVRDDAVEISASDPSALAEALRPALPFGETTTIDLPEKQRELPKRPRLARHVQVRIHLLEGEPRVLINDYRSEALAQVSLASWAALQLADGTRDLDALTLAMVREGLYAGAADLMELLTPLHDVDLIVDGLELPAAKTELAPLGEPDARPLVPLPDYTFVCDGKGACCRSYDTVAFMRVEAMTARVMSERMRMSISPDDAFTPLSGPTFEDTFAVAQRDGRCAFLEDDDLCGLHRIGGPNAKPHGCRFYPTTFTDDGTEVRVSLTPECACAFMSVATDAGGPLVPSTAKTFGDVRYDARVGRVTDPVPLSPTRGATPAELRAWSSELVDLLAGDLAIDAAHLAWRLAHDVESGLGPIALEPIAPPAASEITPWIAALRARATATATMSRGWRGARDMNRLTIEWLEGALALDDAAILALPANDPKSERFYLRTLAHGHRLAVEGRSLDQGLRDRAVRMFAARAMARIGLIDDPAGRYPLAPLEAAMRNLSLVRYLEEIKAA